MRAILLFIVCIPFLVKAQTNTFPSSGNVGIGTTNPNAKLELKTTSVGTSALRLSSSAVGANSLNIVATGTEETTGGGGRSNVASCLFQRASDGADLFQLDLTNRQSYFVGENVGIGTTSPFGKLAVVKGSTRIEMAPNGTGLGDVFRIFGLNGSAFTVNSVVTSSGKLITDLGINYAVNGDHGGLSYALIGTKKAPVLRLSAEDGSIALYGDNGTGSDYRTPTFNLGLYVQGDGKIGIGTTNTQGYQLAVNGDAIFTKVKVKTYAAWPDYVFNKGYNLRPLQEVEHFIAVNKHLPDVPSAAEVEKEGLNLGDNQAVLLKKIEELTLYIIDLQKQIDELKK
ncbi:MAG: hypothetical protein ACTHLE_17930 [Agriterribacter sp.]